MIESAYLLQTGISITEADLEDIMQECDSISVRFASSLAEKNLFRNSVGFLSEPSVVLQARTGAVGGNPVTVNMTGMKSTYVDPHPSEPFKFEPYVSSNEGSKTFVRMAPMKYDE